MWNNNNESPVCRVFDVKEALPTSGYLTMLGSVSRREGCVIEVADDAVVVVMATDGDGDELWPV